MRLLQILSAFAILSLATLAFPTPSFAAEEDDYSPIEASNVSEQAIVPQKISHDLDRPIQVGVFIGVPNIFVRQNVHQQCKIFRKPSFSCYKSLESHKHCP